MRKIFLQIHLWVGLLAGAVVSIAGVTGALYVFQPELTTLLYPQFYKAGEQTATQIGLREVIRKAEQQFGSEVITINFPVRELQNYILKVKGKDAWLFYDAGTGKYLGAMLKRRGLMDEVLDMHRTLTLGEKGAFVTGICTILFAFGLLTTGILLWWPGKKRKFSKGLKLKPNTSFKRRNFDIHNVFGFYLSLPLFVIAITGLNFSFPVQTQQVINTLTGTDRTMPEPKQLKSAYRKDVPAMDIYQALELMDKKYGTYQKRYLILPKDSTGYVYFSYTNEDSRAYSAYRRPAVYLDQYSGKTLFEYDPAQAPIGHKLIRNWFLPLHFGEVGGYLTRIVWVILGLAPAMLWVTGILIWRGKFKKQKSAAREQQTLISIEIAWFQEAGLCIKTVGFYRLKLIAIAG